MGRALDKIAGFSSALKGGFSPRVKKVIDAMRKRSGSRGAYKVPPSIKPRISFNTGVRNGSL